MSHIAICKILVGSVMVHVANNNNANDAVVGNFSSVSYKVP